MCPSSFTPPCNALPNLICCDYQLKLSQGNFRIVLDKSHEQVFFCQSVNINNKLSKCSLHYINCFNYFPRRVLGDSGNNLGIMWIGAHDLETANSWKWLDGASIPNHGASQKDNDKFGWAPAHPPGSSAGKRCLAYSPQIGKVTNHQCQLFLRRGLCERSTSSC